MLKTTTAEWLKARIEHRWAAVFTVLRLTDPRSGARLGTSSSAGHSTLD